MLKRNNYSPKNIFYTDEREQLELSKESLNAIKKSAYLDNNRTKTRTLNFKGGYSQMVNLIGCYGFAIISDPLNSGNSEFKFRLINLDSGLCSAAYSNVKFLDDRDGKLLICSNNNQTGKPEDLGAKYYIFSLDDFTETDITQDTDDSNYLMSLSDKVSEIRESAGLTPDDVLDSIQLFKLGLLPLENIYCEEFYDDNNLKEIRKTIGENYLRKLSDAQAFYKGSKYDRYLSFLISEMSEDNAIINDKIDEAAEIKTNNDNGQIFKTIKQRSINKKIADSKKRTYKLENVFSNQEDLIEYLIFRWFDTRQERNNTIINSSHYEEYYKQLQEIIESKFPEEAEEPSYKNIQEAAEAYFSKTNNDGQGSDNQSNNGQNTDGQGDDGEDDSMNR